MNACTITELQTSSGYRCVHGMVQKLPSMIFPGIQKQENVLVSKAPRGKIRDVREKLPVIFLADEEHISNADNTDHEEP